MVQQSCTSGEITEQRGLRNLLHHSARNGTVNLLKIVVKDPNIVNELLEAAGKNDSTEVDRIITQLGLENLDGAAESGTLGVIIEERGLRKLLHHSARNGTVNLLKIMLKDPNINIDAQQELGCTALILACQYGHVDVATLLLEKGADVLLCSNDGFSCLHVAAYHGHTKVVNLLLHGKSDRIVRDYRETRLALILKKTLAEMFSALHMAAYPNEGVEIAASILEFMTTAVFHKHELPPGANLRASFDLEEELWQDFLFKVRGELHGQGGEISEEMIQQNMMTFRKSGVGSAIQRKLGGKYESIVQAFVEIVSYANARDAWGRTALHHAAWEDRDGLVRFLMWNSSLPAGRDSPEKSLLGCLVNINLADYDGYTPLHLAAKKNCKVAVMQLLRPTERALYDNYGLLVQALQHALQEAPHALPHIIDEHIAKAMQRSRDTLSSKDEIDWRFAEEDCLLPNAVANPEGRCQKITMEIKMFLEMSFGKEADSRSGRPVLLPRPRLDYSIWTEDRKGITPLHYAVENEHDEVVELLRHHPKTDVFLCASDGQSPWSIAFPPRWKLPNTKFTNTQNSLRGKFDSRLVVRQELGGRLPHMLLKQAVVLARRVQYDSESSKNLQMLERQICLAFAFVLLPKDSGFHVSQKIRERLLDAREDINLDDLNLTLLHVASYYGYEQEIAELLTLNRYRRFVNEQEKLTKMGQTALHFAVAGRTDAVATLLKGDRLDLTRTNSLGLTPLDSLEKAIRISSQVESRARSRVVLRNPSYWRAKRLNWERTKRLLLQNTVLTEILYRDRQVYVDAANAILVGAALIASVTFAGFLQPPLGYVNYGEYLPDPSPPSTPADFAAVGQYRSVRIFWVFNSLSFFSAIATVVCGAGAVLPASNSAIEHEVRMVRKWLKATAVLLAVSIICVLGAFTAAGMATLPNIAKYQSNIIATATVGFVLCLFVLSAFFYRLYLSLDAARCPRKFVKGAFRFFLRPFLFFLFLLYSVFCCVFMWGPINLIVLIGKFKFPRIDRFFENFTPLWVWRNVYTAIVLRWAHRRRRDRGDGQELDNI